MGKKRQKPEPARYAFALASAVTAGAAVGLASPSAALGAWAGWLVTPDIDVDHRTYEERRIRRALGPVGVVWQMLWCPYALLFRHRGVSHWPVVGTLTRAGYLAAIVAVLATVVGYDVGLAVARAPAWAWVQLLAGWMAQDIVHLALDDWRL